MKKDNIVLVYLSLSLLIVQALWMRSVKRTAYLEGQQAVYNSFKALPTDGTCYAENDDCVNNPNGETTE